MGRQDEIGLQRQNIAGHALEIVLERISLGPGVDDFELPAAGSAVEEPLELFWPRLFAVAQGRAESLRLAERDDAKPAALLARDLRAAKAGGIYADGRVEHAARTARNQHEGQLLLGVGRFNRFAD